MAQPVATGAAEIDFAGGGSYTSTRTHNVTVPGDAEIVFAALFNGYPADTAISTVPTFGGTNMTRVDVQMNTGGATGAGVDVFYIKSGQSGFGTGAKAIVWTFSDGGGGDMVSIVSYYKTIDTTSTLGTPVKGNGFTSPSTRTVVTDTNALVLDWFSKQMSAAAETITKDAAQTANGRQDSGNVFLECQAGHSYQAGGASIDMKWTMSSTTRGYSHIAVALNGTGGGGGSVVPVLMNQYRQRRN